MRNPEKLVIKHAAQLITISEHEKIATSPRVALGIIEDGALIVENGNIHWVGKTADLPDIVDAATIIDASDNVVMPGFIDSHTHLMFSGYREHEFEERLRGATYKDIATAGGGVKKTVQATRQASQEELFTLTKKRLDKMLRLGTTTVEIKSGYGLSTAEELKMLYALRDLRHTHPMDIVPTFMGAHEIPAEYEGKKTEYVDLVVSEMIPRVAEEHLAEFCDVFCEKDVFSIEESRKVLEAAQRHGLKLRIHADELYPFKAAELAAELNVVAASHLLMISDSGIETLLKHDVIAELLPGVPFFSYLVKYAPARRLLQSGVKVSLATDCNPGSCMTECLPVIMTIACTQMRMAPAETILAVTVQAARGLKRFDRVGSLEVGKKADILVLDIPNYQFLVYHFGVNHVKHVIKNGKLVVGN